MVCEAFDGPPHAVHCSALVPITDGRGGRVAGERGGRRDVASRAGECSEGGWVGRSIPEGVWVRREIGKAEGVVGVGVGGEMAASS